MEWKEGNINTARELYQRALSIDSTTESAARCLQVEIVSLYGLKFQYYYVSISKLDYLCFVLNDCSFLPYVFFCITML